MMCENCRKNSATTYYKQNINGKVTEMFLCEECAKKLGVNNSGMFDSFANSFFNDFGGFDFLMPEFTRAYELGQEKKCECGTTFSKIAKTGLVGCEKCYETFKNELASSLRKMHGNVRHKPRELKKTATVLSPEDEVKQLKNKMAQAIKEENFEEAARLRDEIKARESK